MKIILAITRAVVGLATRLHLTSLSTSITVAERKVVSAVRKTNTAVAVRNAAMDTLAIARVAVKDTRRVEAAIKADFSNFVAAARAEADLLSMNHNVGK